MHEHIVTINNKKVRYLEENTHAPETLILLHGIGATANTFSTLFKTIDSNLRLIAVDFPGRGSDKLEKNNIANFADWLVKFIDYLNLNKINLFGMSLGGAVALRFAYKYPERLDKLIIQAPPISSKVIGSSRRPAIFFALRALDSESLIKLLNKVRKNDLWLWRFVRVFAAVNRKWKSKVLDPLGKENIMYIVKNNDLKVLKELLQDLNSLDITGILSQIKIPTLALMGGLDRAIDPKSLKIIEKSMPNVTTKFFPEEDHMMVLVNPNLVSKEITSFLQEPAEKVK